MMPLSDVRDQVYQNIDSGTYDKIEAQYIFKVWEALVAQVGRPIILDMTNAQIKKDIQ